MKTARKASILLILLLTLVVAEAQAQTDRNSIVTIKVPSKLLCEVRHVFISKPLGYDNSDEEYFVVYVLDGESSIDYTKAVTEMLYQSGFPKILVVAIPNTFRNRDLTHAAGQDAEDGGGAANFLQFIKQELIPTIESKYRVHPYRVLIGHSFGGLFATYAMTQETELFDAMVAISPSVFFDDASMMKKVDQLFTNKKPHLPDFYFAMGDERGEEGNGIKAMNQFFKKSAPKNLAWKFDYFPRESHTTVPLKATLDGLRFVFRDFLVSHELLNKNVTALEKYYDKASIKFRKKILVPQRSLMNMADLQWTSGRRMEAIETAKYYAETYPNAIIARDYLSDYYLREGKIDLAIAEVKNMLEIIPGFRHATEKLKRLNAMKNSLAK